MYVHVRNVVLCTCSCTCTSVSRCKMWFFYVTGSCVRTQCVRLNYCIYKKVCSRTCTWSSSWASLFCGVCFAGMRRWGTYNHALSPDQKPCVLIASQFIFLCPQVLDLVKSWTFCLAAEWVCALYHARVHSLPLLFVHYNFVNEIHQPKPRASSIKVS